MAWEGASAASARTPPRREGANSNTRAGTRTRTARRPGDFRSFPRTKLRDNWVAMRMNRLLLD